MEYERLCRRLCGAHGLVDVYTKEGELFVPDGSSLSWPSLRLLPNMRPLREGELPEDTMKELYGMIKEGNGACEKPVTIS